MYRWNKFVDQFMEECQAAGCVESTIDNYRWELDKFETWLKRRKPKPKIDQINSDLIQAYVKDRTCFRAKSTVSGVMSKIRCFGEFLVREGHWTNNPLRWMQGPKIPKRHRLPRRIKPQAMVDLMEAAATTRNEYHRFLWVTVLSVFYGTGPRRGEVERLDLEHWDQEQGIFQFDGHKTNHPRSVPVPPLVKQCLEAYLPKRQNRLEATGHLDEKALFINKDGVRLKASSISVAMKKLARKTGNEQISLHQYRHTCASDLLESGANLPQVQEILGHQVIATTMRYLHVADPQLHQAVESHPINKFLNMMGATYDSAESKYFVRAAGGRLFRISFRCG